MGTNRTLWSLVWASILAACTLVSPAIAESVRRVPILFILLEIDTGNPAQTFDPTRTPALWRSLLDGTSEQNAPSYRSVIDFAEPGDPGARGASAPFPLPCNSSFAMRAKATIVVSPAHAGPWTIGVRSDDGAQVSIDGRPVVQNDGLHAPRDAVGTTTLGVGSHQLELLYFNLRDTSCMVELLAAQGTHAALGPAFDIVGSGSVAGLAVAAPGFEIRQRYARADLTSLADAEQISDAPFHNVIDYFLENSYGALQLVPATGGDTVDGAADGIVGPFALPTLVTDANQKRRAAMQAADGSFNFAFYDAPGVGGNGNGFLDQHELAVVVLTGQPDGDSPCGNTRPPDRAFFVDGVLVSTAFQSSAVTQWCGWATLVHEISHLLSEESRDLYNLDDDSTAVADDLKPYAVMASTSYDQGSMHHDPWTKIRLGWLAPRLATSSGIYTLQAIETRPDVLRIDNPNDPLEYLLIENRWSRAGSHDRAAFHTDFPNIPPAARPREFRSSSGIPADGLAIWHVDEKRLSAFSANDFSAPQFLRRIWPTAGSNVLWDGRETFANRHWNDGKPMNVVIPCATRPGPTVSAVIRFSASGLPFDDRFELAGPNNDPRDATPITLASPPRNLTIHADCDVDYFSFRLGDYSDLAISAPAFGDLVRESAAAGPQLELRRGDDLVARQQESIVAKRIMPGDYTLRASSSVPLYYDLAANVAGAAIDPDRFDDPLRSGRPRNDSAVDATLLSIAQGPVPPAVQINVPGVVRAGGRGMSHREPDLNFDRTSDSDFFRVAVDVGGFLYSPGVDVECPDIIGPDVEGYSSKRRRGYLRIAVFPDLDGPLDLAVFDSAGKTIPDSGAVRRWANSWNSGIEIDCPTRNLPGWIDASGNGTLVVGVSDPQRRRNLYELAIDYQEAQVFAVDRSRFPHEVWRLENVAVLPPRRGPVELTLPYDPSRCVSAVCGPIADRFAFAWPETAALTIAVRSVDAPLIVVLVDQRGRLIGEQRVEGEGTLRVSSLRPGPYLLQVSTPRAAPVRYSLEFSSH